MLPPMVDRISSVGSSGSPAAGMAVGACADAPSDVVVGAWADVLSGVAVGDGTAAVVALGAETVAIALAI